jgi:hypothetical protein
MLPGDQDTLDQQRQIAREQLRAMRDLLEPALDEQARAIVMTNCFILDQMISQIGSPERF